MSRGLVVMVGCSCSKVMGSNPGAVYWMKDHCTDGLRFRRFDMAKEENMLLFVCIKAVESKLVHKAGDQP